MLNKQSRAISLQINVLNSYNAFSIIKSDWERLSRSTRQTPVFQLWEWSSLWWKHYHTLGELVLITVSIDGLIEGIAPFYRKNSKALKLKRVTELYFIGTGGDTSPDDLDIICNPEYEEAIADAVCHFILDDQSIDRYHFSDLSNDSIFAARFLIHTEQKKLPKITVQQRKRKVMKLPGSYTDYLALLTKNTRKRIKHRHNRLQNEDNIAFKRCVGEKDIDYGFTQLVKLHHARRSVLGPSDSFTSSAYLAFHRDLIQVLALKNEVYLLLLTKDDKPIGAEYAYYSGNVISFFQTGFDPAYERLSPGHVMMSYIIKDAIENGATGIDLLKGDYSYKDSYAKQERRSVTLTLWRSQTIAAIKLLISKLRQQLAPGKNQASSRKCMSDSGSDKA